MKKIESYLKNFQVMSLLKPLFITILLSFLYNLGYLFSLAADFDYMVRYGLQLLLSLLSALGMYYICSLVWFPASRHRFDTMKILWILGIQAVVLVLIQGILLPASLAFYDVPIVQMVLSLAAGCLLIFGYPLILLAWYGLSLGYEKPKSLFAWVTHTFARHWRPLLNGFCALLLFVMAVDTLWWGVMGLQEGFSVVDLVNRLFFMANPMMNWMLYMFVSLVQSVSFVSSWVNIFICFLIGFLYAILELNYVLLVQRKGEESGTGSPETYTPQN